MEHSKLSRVLWNACYILIFFFKNIHVLNPAAYIQLTIIYLYLDSSQVWQAQHVQNSSILLAQLMSTLFSAQARVLWINTYIIISLIMLNSESNASVANCYEEYCQCVLFLYPGEGYMSVINVWKFTELYKYDTGTFETYLYM